MLNYYFKSEGVSALGKLCKNSKFYYNSRQLTMLDGQLSMPSLPSAEPRYSTDAAVSTVSLSEGDLFILCKNSDFYYNSEACSAFFLTPNPDSYWDRMTT